MGAWGFGIFENDSALDYAGALFLEITCELRKNLDEEFLNGFDMTDQVKAQAFFLGALAKAYPHHDRFTAANVEDWKSRAIRIFRDTRHCYIEVTEKVTEAEVKRITEVFDELARYEAIPEADISDEDFEATYGWWKKR